MKMSAISISLRNGSRIVIEESIACTSSRGIECFSSEIDLSVEDAEKLVYMLQEGINCIREKES